MANCRHHFLIPTMGIVAVGVCKFCGAEKRHLNSPEEVKFNLQKRSKTPIVLTNSAHVSIFAKRGRKL